MLSDAKIEELKPAFFATPQFINAGKTKGLKALAALGFFARECGLHEVSGEDVGRLIEGGPTTPAQWWAGSQWSADKVDFQYQSLLKRLPADHGYPKECESLRILREVAMKATGRPIAIIRSTPARNQVDGADLV